MAVPNIALADCAIICFSWLLSSPTLHFAPLYTAPPVDRSLKRVTLPKAIMIVRALTNTSMLLCFFLAAQNFELITVFCTFALSQLLSFIFANANDLVRLTAGEVDTVKQQQQQKDTATDNGMTVQNKVGVAMLSLAALQLYLNLGAFVELLLASLDLTGIVSPLSLGSSSTHTPEYGALTTICGWLVYDLWNFQRDRVWRIVEHTTALSLVLTALTNKPPGLDLTLSGTSDCIGLWMGYKTILLLWMLTFGHMGSSESGVRSSSSCDEDECDESAGPMTKDADDDSRTSEHTASTSTSASLSKEEKADDVDVDVPVDRFATLLPQAQPKPSPEEAELWQIHGKFYSLEKFVRNHPGGSHSILLGKGRDSTALFESYHTFTMKHAAAVLSKYEVERPVDATCPLDDLKDSKNEVVRDKFYEVMKERVEKRLIEVGIDPVKDRCATLSRLAYYSVIAVSVLYTLPKHCEGKILYSFLSGVAGWLLGSMGHDSGHFSVSKVPFVNNVCTWGMLLICNPIMWQYQHTYGHHSHTNEYELDPDLHHFNVFLRYHRRMIYDKVYKNQESWFYVLLNYTSVTFGECIKIPWGVLLDNDLYGIVHLEKNPLKKIGLCLHFLAYVAFVVVVPFFYTNAFKAFSCMMLHMITTGLLFAFFSQINHINEASIDLDRSKKQLADSWAATQVETSNNFAPHSFFWHVLSNGLNMQIEHHLFPGLNHCHLHHIAPVVKATCEEYGVTYKCYDTWSELFGATLQWLDKLSSASTI